MYTINMRVRCSDTFSELCVDDIEHAELTVESILSVALLEMFDAVLVENVTVEHAQELCQEESKQAA